MVFTVETGDGLADSNSYASYAAFVAYFADRGVTVTAPQPAVEAALVKGADYLDGGKYCWRGTKLTTEQAMQWPRACVYGQPTFDEPGGAVIEGVPAEVVRANIELANRALTEDLAPDPAVDVSGMTVTSSRKKVGPIEVETAFDGGGSSSWVRSFPAVDAMLRYLTQSSGGRVWRA
jgi:hypothetical protein